MKKIILILAGIFSVLMVGCGKQAGGDYQAAIMVNGVVYYSTDNTVPEEPDRGNIQYTSSYAENGVPSKDGETNFDRDLGCPYSFLDDESVIVMIDNEWIQFKTK